MINKYGKEAVSTIKYKDQKLRKGEYSPKSIKVMNERTNNASNYATSGAKTIASLAISTAMGLPISLIYVPKTTGQKAANLEYQVYRANVESQRQRQNR